MDYPTYNEQKISTILTDDLETASYNFIDGLDDGLTEREQEYVRKAFVAGGKHFRRMLYKSLED